MEYWLPALIAVALIVLGVLAGQEPWRTTAVGAGIGAVVIVGVAIAVGSWLISVYGLLLTMSAATVVAGARTADGALIGAGLLAFVAVAATAPLAVLLRSIMDRHGDGDRRLEELRGIVDELRKHSILSDNAKRVLYRERELGLLRDAIEADIAQGKYNVGLTLCDEMADVFGYLEEAEVFRGRILEARQQRYESDVMTAMARFDELLAQRDWAMVHQEAARIRRLYHDSHLVQDMDLRILQARQEHKRELEDRFLAAAQRDDAEAAMPLLRELDRYLEPHEAERLSEVAQGVVARHRENLGVQFKLAVNDHRWGESVRIGEEIIGEFPNTKMADEVRTMIDTLRTRAEHVSLTNAPEG